MPPLPRLDEQFTPTEEASLQTVIVAVAANLLIAVAKGVAAVPTHSLADTCNEVLLYVGVRRGMRPADDRHPLGYGQARFFWSLLAAVGIFVIGGLFAIAQGVQTLRRPESVTDVPIGVAVLLVSAALVGLSWRTARRQLRTEAAVRHVGRRGQPAIGLMVVAYLLVRRNAAMLIDEAPPADIPRRRPPAPNRTT